MRDKYLNQTIYWSFKGDRGKAQQMQSYVYNNLLPKMGTIQPLPFQHWVRNFPDGAVVSMTRINSGLAPIVMAEIYVPRRERGEPKLDFGLYLDSGYITLPHISWFFGDTEDHYFFPLPIYMTQDVKQEATSRPYEGTALISARSKTVKNGLIVSKRNPRLTGDTYDYYFKEWSDEAPLPTDDEYPAFSEALDKIKQRQLYMVDRLGGMLYPLITLPPHPPHRWTGMARLAAQALYTSHARYFSLEALINVADPDYSHRTRPDYDNIIVSPNYDFFIVRVWGDTIRVVPLKYDKPAALGTITESNRHKVLAYLMARLDKMDADAAFTLSISDVGGFAPSYGWHFSYTDNEAKMVTFRSVDTGTYNPEIDGNDRKYQTTIRTIRFTFADDGKLSAEGSNNGWTDVFLPGNFWTFMQVGYGIQSEVLYNDRIYSGTGYPRLSSCTDVPIYGFYDYSGQFVTVGSTVNLNPAELEPKEPEDSGSSGIWSSDYLWAFTIESNASTMSYNKRVSYEHTPRAAPFLGGFSCGEVRAVHTDGGYFEQVDTFEYWAEEAGSESGCVPFHGDDQGPYNMSDYISSGSQYITLPATVTYAKGYRKATSRWFIGALRRSCVMLVKDNPDAVNIAWEAGTETTGGTVYVHSSSSADVWKKEVTTSCGNPLVDDYIDTWPELNGTTWYDSDTIGTEVSLSHLVSYEELPAGIVDGFQELATVSAAGKSNGGQLRDATDLFGLDDFFEPPTIYPEQNIAVPAYSAIDSFGGVSYHRDKGVHATEDLDDFAETRAAFVGWA